jgi:HD domain
MMLSFGPDACRAKDVRCGALGAAAAMEAKMIIQLPDSPLCLAALELATQNYEPFLLNHSLRSFLFGAAFGAASGREFDSELLYVSCLLHDLGLAGSAPVQTRFEVEGADAAQRFLASQGVAPAAQELVWDAIALHTTSVIPQRKRAEIALCQLGTAIDVGFAPSALLPLEVIEVVVRAFPRLDFKRAMAGALCGLAKRNPEAARLSLAASDAAERHLPGFARPHLCDVMSAAAFSE